MKTVAAAMGADVSGESSSKQTPMTDGIDIDQSPKLVSKDENPQNETMTYGAGEIKLGSSTAFGYQSVEKID